MKNTIVTYLSKPRTIIPAFAVVAILLGVILFHLVGKPPVVQDLSTMTASNTASENTLNLSFNASGRVGIVSVSVGDTVAKGQILASLDAGVALGALNQAKGALELAKAQYGSLSLQYQNAKTQQDVLVRNAYRTLLSAGIQALPFGNFDQASNPVITGTYTCDKEGQYEIDIYASGVESGYSFTFKGLESGTGHVTYGTAQPLGTCGLFVTFTKGFTADSKWTVSIPNIKSSSYQANKNAYDLAVSTRDQVLSQLSANLGQGGDVNANVSAASITAAQGAYDAALAQYQNTIIVAPVNGTVSFIDSTLTKGQSVVSGRPVISIIPH